MRNKIEQLRELVSEAEDVCRQMEATKQQISDRLAECCSSLQRIQDSLLTLSGSDAAETHEKLKVGARIKYPHCKLIEALRCIRSYFFLSSTGSTFPAPDPGSAGREPAGGSACYGLVNKSREPPGFVHRRDSAAAESQRHTADLLRGGRES